VVMVGEIGLGGVQRGRRQVLNPLGHQRHQWARLGTVGAEGLWVGVDGFHVVARGAGGREWAQRGVDGQVQRGNRWALNSAVSSEAPPVGAIGHVVSSVGIDGFHLVARGAGGHD
jgi:hypothetical protein